MSTQGTNAHVLLQQAQPAAAGSLSDEPPTQALPWSRSRLWSVPQPSPLLHRALLAGGRALGSGPGSGSALLFETLLDDPALLPMAVACRAATAASAGRTALLLPPSLLLGVASAAASMAVAGPPGGAARDSALLLQQGVFHPCGLPGTAPRGTALHCSVDCTSGRITVALVAGGGSGGAGRTQAITTAFSASICAVRPRADAMQAPRQGPAGTSGLGQEAIHALARALFGPPQPAAPMGGALAHAGPDGGSRQLAGAEAEVTACAALGAALQLPDLLQPAVGPAVHQPPQVLSGFGSCLVLPAAGSGLPTRPGAQGGQQLAAAHGRLGAPLTLLLLSGSDAALPALRLHGVTMRPAAEAAREAAKAAAATAAPAAVVPGQAVREAAEELGEQEEDSVRYVVEWRAAARAEEEDEQQAAAAPVGGLTAGPASPGRGAGDMLASLAAVQMLAAASSTGGTPALQLVTRGARPSSSAPPAGGQPASAAAWAVARTLALEQPNLQVAAYDEDPGGPAAFGPQRSVVWCSGLGRPGSGIGASGSASGVVPYGRSASAGVAYEAVLTPVPAVASLPGSTEAVGTAGADAGIQPVLPRRGTYVVTGGSGMAALHIARWLASEGVAHVHLVSRSGALPDGLLLAQPELLLGPQADGSEAPAAPATAFTASKADASFAEDAAWAMLGPAAGGGAGPQLPVLGVMHAAGHLEDALAGSVTASAARRVLAPKLAGWAALQAAACPQPSAAHVLFSSVASLLGSPGQASYSAANAGLDAAAAQRAAQGVPAASVQFGAWAGAGMAARQAGTAARLERLGMGMLQPQQALEAVAAVVASLAPAPAPAPAWMRAPTPLPVTAVVPFRWRAFLSAQADAQRRLGRPAVAAGAFFADAAHYLLEATAAPAAVAATSRASAAAAAAAVVDLDQLRQEASAAVADALAAVLGTEGDAAPGPHQPLMAAGLDSLGAVELTSSLEARLGLQLPRTLVFDYPTLSTLTAHLTQLLAARAGSGSGVAAAPAEAAAAGLQLAAPMAGLPASAGSAPTSQAVVIIRSLVSRGGMQPGGGGAFGGSGLDRDPVAGVPLQRWDVDADPAAALEARHGRYLPGVDLFDAALFGISGSEAVLLDPQQRLLLEGLHEALAAAGGAALGDGLGGGGSGSVGTYLGVASSDYGSLVKAHGQQRPGAFHATANALSVTAGRLAFTFGLTGKWKGGREAEGRRGEGACMHAVGHGSLFLL